MTPTVFRPKTDYVALYWRRNRWMLDGSCEQISLMRSAMNVAGNCLDPVPIELFARPGATHGKDVLIDVKNRTPIPVALDLLVRCRKCQMCLEAKRHHWRFRAMAECAKAPRTWFATLTLRPAVWDGLMLAGQRSAREGTSPRDSGLRMLMEELTRWLKRLRKSLKANLRYLASVEWHKSGVPHIHLLLHCSENVTYREVRGRWTFGFEHYQLIRNSAVGAKYVTKYLVKQLGASVRRVRASLTYGSDHTICNHRPDHNGSSRDNRATLGGQLPSKGKGDGGNQNGFPPLSAPPVLQVVTGLKEIRTLWVGDRYREGEAHGSEAETETEAATEADQTGPSDTS